MSFWQGGRVNSIFGRRGDVVAAISDIVGLTAALAGKRASGNIVVPVPLIYATGATTFTAIPASFNEFNATSRHSFDTTLASRCWATYTLGSTNGPAGSVIEFQYSTDQSSWTSLIQAAFDVTALRAYKTTPITIPAGAVGSLVYFRFGTNLGNASSSPVAKQITLWIELTL